MESLEIASFLPGIFFGLVGFYLLKFAKQRSNLKVAVIAAVLLMYPYFVPNPWLSWAIGFALCGLAYRERYS